ncbi:MAG: hypothetical protein ACRD4S_11095 [Candidatus Acidiferrales bacterium]
MADWRQIQARIRKARTAADAPAKLSELYQRTRDAMVAWELGAIEEKAARNEEAVKWYTIAAQRFRRADWKKKAEGALTRLGADLPAASAGSESEARADEPPSETPATLDEGKTPLALGEISDVEMSTGESESIPASAGTHEAASSTQESGDANKKKRRRGRRGGRGRHRKAAATTGGLPSQAYTKPVEPLRTVSRGEAESSSRTTPAERQASLHVQTEPQRAAHVEHVAPTLPSERTAHGRAGEPALASRMAHLESMLRRLLSSPLHRLDALEEAPAGPGVFLLSDSDQVTSYYIEACQTLRVGVGNLVRGGRTGKSTRSGGRTYTDSNLKPKLAEHLEINESKVGQYMKDHCVVRWIQLDDEAAHLAHFAIGVLRTPLNID